MAPGVIVETTRRLRTGRVGEVMFTGIVEEMGRIESVVPTADGFQIRIRARLARGVPVGASVAVEGTCLTATATDGDMITVEVVPETLDRTSLGRFEPGDAVNLERAMPASGRFDGHVVQGHVDGVGTVAEVVSDGDGVRVRVECPERLLRYVVDKGSITVNGVSLTVASLDPRGFGVALIPHTLAVTTLGRLGTGDAVNLEVDILAKYVERLLEARA